MRVFSASLATETNTFGPMPTSLASFKDRGYFAAGKHPDAMTLFSGPLWAARMRGADKGWQLFEGMVAGAQPSGTTTRHAYETLRDEMLNDLRARHHAFEQRPALFLAAHARRPQRAGE